METQRKAIACHAMHTSELLRHYGYYAIFFAGLFEGETILLLGAYAVHQGYLQMPLVIGFGAAAAFVSDQFYFFLGRRRGPTIEQKYPRIHQRLDKVSGFTDRHPITTVLVMRFAWGLRIVLPIALGMGRMRAALYVPLSAVASLLWACTVAYFGVAISEFAHRLIGNLRHHEHTILLGTAVAALLVALWQLRLRQQAPKVRPD
ncbi:MAG: hypothetical protein JWP29_5095 [Rhodoferax sp.]|nr:hypothetical protein [Rhodoferax sp.]